MDTSSCKFKPVLAGTRIPHLRSLRIRRSGTVEWLFDVYFPQLDYFSYDWCSLQQIDQFLARHQTVTAVSIPTIYGDTRMGDLQNMVHGPNRVLSITISNWWIEYLGADDAFPSLRSLTIKSPYCVGVGDFDRLVKKRCLPLSHPESEAQSPSRILDEMFLEGDEDWIYKGSLTKSRWFIYATKEVQRKPESHDAKIKLTWPINTDTLL
jgi:hypothetical protein